MEETAEIGSQYADVALIIKTTAAPDLALVGLCYAALAHGVICGAQCQRTAQADWYFRCFGLWLPRQAPTPAAGGAGWFAWAAVATGAIWLQPALRNRAAPWQRWSGTPAPRPCRCRAASPPAVALPEPGDRGQHAGKHTCQPEQLPPHRSAWRTQAQPVTRAPEIGAVCSPVPGDRACGQRIAARGCAFLFPFLEGLRTHLRLFDLAPRPPIACCALLAVAGCPLLIEC